jgi:hypothetical protein
MPEGRRLIAPYVEWAVLTNFAYLEGEWFRVLLEIEGSAAAFAKQVEGSGSDITDLIRVPSIYQTPSSGFKDTELTFCTAIMTRRALTALVREGEIKKTAPKFAALIEKSIKRIELGTPAPVPNKPSPAEVVELLSARPPDAAVVAVIDDGLAFAHERFRLANGKTRFKYFWNQDDSTGQGLPAGFGWGRELAEAEINTLLASCSHSGLVDEDAL